MKIGCFDARYRSSRCLGQVPSIISWPPARIICKRLEFFRYTTRRPSECVQLFPVCIHVGGISTWSHLWQCLFQDLTSLITRKMAKHAERKKEVKIRIRQKTVIV